MADLEAVTVEVDYRVGHSPDPTVVGRVMELYDRGVLVKQIASEVGLSRSAIQTIIGAGLTQAGRERVDGRTRRSTLTAKHAESPLYQAVSDRVKELADRGRLFVQIAADLDLDRNTVTAAWRHWHASRGLPVPDGRGRRKTLAVKSSVEGSTCQRDPKGSRTASEIAGAKVTAEGTS